MIERVFIQGLATYYLVVAIQTSELPVWLFNRFVLRAKPDERVGTMDEVITLLYAGPRTALLGGLLGCAACLSFWVAALMSLLGRPAEMWLLSWVGTAGTALLIRQLHDRMALPAPPLPPDLSEMLERQTGQTGLSTAVDDLFVDKTK